ncbi:hypothetical protein TRFO_14124 [Tritrichomonas foetus]|uniref:Uncharacterized protein n=1 Tax=Tritrichomonas foetus TaxID=1144522 RepID=A0A1J4L0B1_9EUKA|nr:hypothetical protein TRFO_14124 [Tritrichomonas foetus]|eukprot:OHT15372.1 hypothetical protein TRFO_14124 [Tritrichomonas foetus]
MSSQADQIATLESRLQELAMELDTMKSSRNYYKDQCESLLISLANSVQNHVPAYRTQKEVEEMIESIEAQQKAKRQKLKTKCNEQINDFRKTIDSLQIKITEQEKTIQEQEDVRVGLIEKLMFYKKSLNEASTLQQETELKLSQLRSSESMLIDNSVSEQMIEEMKASHSNEVNQYRLQIKKLRKKVKYLANSLDITQAANDESNADIAGLSQELKKLKETEQQLRADLAKEKQTTTDAASLLKIAMVEADQMQNEAQVYAKRIQELLFTIDEQENTMAELHKSLMNTMAEAQSNKEQLQLQNKDILDFHMKIEEITQQHEAENDKYEDEKAKAVNKISRLEDTISKLKQRIVDSENDKNELQAALNQKMLEINQENRLRKAAELAKETALTNLKNTYALMNANESARHETNIEIEKVTNDLESKTHEYDELIRKYDDLQNRLDISQMQLSTEKEKNARLSNELKRTTSELEDVKATTILKVDVAEQNEQHRMEKAKLLVELKEIQQQYNIHIADNETKEITLKHQEEILKKNVLEMKNVQRQNRILRKKLQQAGFANSSLIENSEDNSSMNGQCQNCDKLQKQVKLLQIKVQRLSDDLTSNEMIMTNSRNVIRNFVSKIAEVVVSSEITPRFMELRAKLDSNSLTFQQEVIEFDSFLTEFIDDLIYHRDGPSSDEAKLLKSTISHMKNKLNALKVQNQLQNEEISNLKHDMQKVSDKKEETEMKMSTLNESLGAFRKTLDITKKKLTQTQKSKNKLKNELSNVKSERFPVSNEVSQIEDYGQDLSDISLVSSHSSKTSYQKQKVAKVTTLSDSLALLDLLCQ